MPALQLIDLTEAYRTGFRGVNAASFLAEQGVDVPAAPNQAVTLVDGRLVLRLSQREFWILAPSAEQDERIDALNEKTVPAACYSLFCRDSHAWFVLSGERRAECMAKLCGVDLRSRVFPLGSIAQTSVARLNTIIVHHLLDSVEGYSILCDSASAEYFEAAVRDAMDEFK